MYRLWTLFLFVLFMRDFCVNGFALPFEGLYRLDIIHYNDFHARYEETSVLYPTCRTNNGSCLGGFPRLYAEVTELLRKKPKALLLNAGDSFQGTYWYTLLKWNVTQQFMNMLPHDAHAIGNHEFDDGPEGLAPYLAHLKAPIVAANMDTSQVPSMKNLYKNHIIVKRGRRRIGIIGLITVDTKQLSSPGAVVFTNERLAAQREAAILTEKGVDIIILLSHCGLDVDKDIAANYGENIDVIVGGHSHSLLWNGPAPSGEAVADVYPVIVQPHSRKDHKVLIVQASAFTKYIGNLSVWFDFRGDYYSWEGGPIFLNRSIPEDEHIKQLLAPYAEIVHAAESEVVGETSVMMEYAACVYGECNLGDAFSDALVEHTKANYSSELPYIAFIARGNMKAGISKGNVTRGTIFEMLPYNDKVLTFSLQGRYILEALEYSVENEWAINPFKAPNVLQVSGLRVTFNTSLAAGARLVAAEVRGADGVFTPLRPDADYQITTADFLAGGGDGFTMVSENRKNVVLIGNAPKIFEEYVRAHSPLNQVADGRVTMLT